jgi:RHS repeat-associated protein
MAEQHSYSGDYTNRYKFNGKELDEETGFYYYGARYYNPKFSIWLSIDPLAEQFPNWNPYNYTMQNPINLVDPDGRKAKSPDDYEIYDDGQIMVHKTDDLTDNFTYVDANNQRTDLGTYQKQENGLIKVEDNSNYFINNSRTSRSYIDPKVMAGILGAAKEYNDETGLTMQINQLNDKNGGHSGHDGNGQFADIRYANNKGDVNESVWTSGTNYDAANSQILANKFTKFGFNAPNGLSILTENSEGNGPALLNTRFVDGNGKFHHKHHMHLQRFDYSRIFQAIEITIEPIIIEGQIKKK